jgi:YfiH family protein
MNCGDAAPDVTANQRRLQSLLPGAPKWLKQVHGNTVVRHDGQSEIQPVADAIIGSQAGQVCAVLTADCLPVLMTDAGGRQVALAHAGWRGLAGDVLKRTIEALDAEPSELMAWLGPGIGQKHYAVGHEVYRIFLEQDPAAAAAFRPSGTRWLADLGLIARQQLQRAGIKAIFGGGFCTFSDHRRFYSYRRDGTTGRMASLIWLL